MIVFVPPHSGRMGDSVLFSSLRQEISALSPSAEMMLLSVEGCHSLTTWKPDTLFLLGVTCAVGDLRHHQELLGRLLIAGVSRSQLRTVLWHEGLPGSLPIDFLAKEKITVDAKFPSDTALLLSCENQGRLLSQLKPKANLTQAIHELAAKTIEWLKPAMSINAEKPSDWPALERRVISQVWTELGATSDRRGLSTEEMSGRIDQVLRQFLQDGRIPPGSQAIVAGLRQRVLDSVTGLGPLEELLRDPSLNEIMVNGLDNIFVERDGRIIKSTAVFESELQLRAVIDRAVARVGRRVDLASPLCDVRLPDGSRVNVVLPPLSVLGPILTIRRFKPLYQSIDDLLRSETVTPAQADRLSRAVLNRENILIAGNSGAGKTTLLNVMASLIEPSERIITLEDAAELQIHQPHVVRLETRPQNAEGRGLVTMAELVVNALRMRPDRLIIGECRGAEVIPMLQAMNTGHDGSMTTLHANSAVDALKRLESLVLLQAPEWPVEVVREQIQAGLDLVVHIKRSGPVRKVMEMVDVE